MPCLNHRQLASADYTCYSLPWVGAAATGWIDLLWVVCVCDTHIMQIPGHIRARQNLSRCRCPIPMLILMFMRSTMYVSSIQSPVRLLHILHVHVSTENLKCCYYYLLLHHKAAKQNQSINKNTINYTI